MNYCNNKHNHHHQGSVRRVTSALANKFNIPRKLVLFGFIIGLFMNFVLTLIVFFLSLYWVNHPKKVEEKFNKVANKVRAWTMGSHSAGSYSGGSRSGKHQGQYAYAGGQTTTPPSSPEPDVDFEFSELYREFEDLERRTADMEKHVSSDEYNLNKEFQKMKKDGK